MSTPSTLQRLDDARAFLLKNGNMPAPSDPFMTPLYEMCGVHAMLLLGLRNIYVVSHSYHSSREDFQILVGGLSESSNHCARGLS